MVEGLPVEDRLRRGEVLDPEATLVFRGSPLTIDGVLANADRTRRRFTFAGQPFVAISVDVTVAGWGVEAILAQRLGTRRSYAVARVGALVDEGFVLVPTFMPPHYSLILPSYTREAAAHLVQAFGEVRSNPHYRPRREP